MSAKSSVGVSLAIAAAMAVAIAGAFFGSGALGGTPIREASGGWLDTDSTLLSPAGPAFGIWSFIYLGLVVYALWQFSATARGSALQHRARTWIAISALLNAAWILVVQFGWLAASLGVILVLLAVLIRIFVLMAQTPAASMPERWIMWLVFGVYLGWVNVATIANTAALLASLGFGDNAAWTVPLAIALLVAAVVIGLGVAWYASGGPTTALAMGWGVAWIGVSRLEPGNYSQPVAYAAFGAATALLLGAVALAWIHRAASPRAVRA